MPTEVVKRLPHFTALTSVYAAQFNLGVARIYLRHGHREDALKALRRSVVYLQRALA